MADSEIEKKIEENSLIERCTRGDYKAFRSLIQQYQSRIYSVCYGILRNREDAFDVMQDVYVKVYNSIKRFHGESGLYSWIYRITVNTCLDYLRKRKRKKEFLDRAYQAQETVGAPKHVKTPEEMTLSLEVKEKVREAIEKLPAKHRAVILLREIEGLSYQEIAKIMNCSEGT